MSEIAVSHDGSTAVVTISNPGKRNAISRDMWQQLLDLLPRLEADESVRVVVLAGAGGDFSAGNDIRGLSHGADTDLPTAGTSGVAGFGKPVVAAIDGYCLGAGAELALAADFRICAADARFGIPPANLGLVFPLPGLRLLVDLVGPAQAKKLIYTAERIDASTALRIGMVDEVVTDGDAMTRALALAQKISTRSQVTIHAAKAMIRALALNHDAEAVTARWRAIAETCPDLPEGRAAFLEKRAPRFTWNG